MKPFVINSNLCLSSADVASYDAMMKVTAGNVGNSYISYSLIKEVCGGYRKVPQIQSLYTYDFKEAEKDIELINGRCSHVFLVLQDQIRIAESYGLQLPYADIIDFLNRVKKPIVVAGLGANSFIGYDSKFHTLLAPELVTFLRKLSERTEVLGVRGYFTQEVLHHLGIHNVDVIGCPSYFESGSRREIVKTGLSSVACSSWVSEKIQLSSTVYLQDMQPHEVALGRVVAFGEPLELSDFEQKLVDERRVRLFSSITAWKRDIAKHSFFVGTRVHGAILALNSGVPAVVMNGDSRAREMCEYLNIPYLPQFDACDDISQIFDSCDYAFTNRFYPEKYKRFEDFLSKFGLKITSREESKMPMTPQMSALLRGGQTLQSARSKKSVKR